MLDNYNRQIYFKNLKILFWAIIKFKKMNNLGLNLENVL